MNLPYVYTLVLFMAIVFTSTSTDAQSGGAFTIEKSVFAAGGTSQGGSFQLDGVFGQPFTGSISGGDFTIAGGFITPQLAPTAAGATISGRVLAPDASAGVRNALVVITDLNGSSRTVVTGTFGRFRFEGIVSGQSYVISIKSRRYLYTEQLITVNENVSDLQFVGESQNKGSERPIEP